MLSRVWLNIKFDLGYVISMPIGGKNNNTTHPNLTSNCFYCEITLSVFPGCSWLSPGSLTQLKLDEAELPPSPFPLSRCFKRQRSFDTIRGGFSPPWWVREGERGSLLYKAHRFPMPRREREDSGEDRGMRQKQKGERRGWGERERAKIKHILLLQGSQESRTGREGRRSGGLIYRQVSTDIFPTTTMCLYTWEIQMGANCCLGGCGFKWSAPNCGGAHTSSQPRGGWQGGCCRSEEVFSRSRQASVTTSSWLPICCHAAPCMCMSASVCRRHGVGVLSMCKL